jgi:hypothetical protein
MRHRVKPSKCLSCGKALDAWTPARDADVEDARTPRPGDFTVCAYCGHLQAFGDDLSFRPLTDDEVVAVLELPKFWRRKI